MQLQLALLAVLLSLCWCHPHFKELLEEEEEDIHDTKEENVVDKILEVNKGKESKLFEGDIYIEESPEEIVTPYGEIESNLLKRGLRRSQEYLWVDRTIPYEITEAVVHGKEVILAALKEISDQSCLKFVEHKKQRNWIRFVDEGSCFSGVGRTFWREGSQKISLAQACLQKGTIMHEVLHALGFWHEQSRPDRNKYVEIFWENIADGEDHNFAKYSAAETNDLKSPYDVQSIMHYGRYSFSKNGEPTIVAIGQKEKTLGQRARLSNEDATQLNRLYKCKDYHMGSIYTSWSDWSPCDSENGCKNSRQRFCSTDDKTKCPNVGLYGVQTDFKVCSKEECYRPIDGHWNRWSAWSKCDKSCGQGTKKRTRICNDPSPKNSGKQCIGAAEMTTECSVVACGLGPDACQFDAQGMCFWKDMSAREYRWRRIKGNTPSKNTGPDGDHSTGEGHYLYTESSAPAAIGMKANLLSRVFPKTTGRCLIFSYSMHGENIGSLRVFTVSEDTAEEKKVWEKNGPQGSGWFDASVPFHSENSYMIKFQSERGESFLGDIGLDDVQFREGSCAVLSPITKYKIKLEVKTTPAPPAPKRDPLTEICGIPVKALGCFAEITHQPAIPNILDSHRGQDAIGYHGVQLSWTKYKESLNSLFCDCLSRAKSRGYKYIGMQYFGECWGVGTTPHYNKYGISTLCIDGKFKPCYHTNDKEVCMGKAQTNYVYELM